MEMPNALLRGLLGGVLSFAWGFYIGGVDAPKFLLLAAALGGGVVIAVASRFVWDGAGERR